MAPNLKKFCGDLVRQKLISPADIERIYRQWRGQQPDDRDNFESFVRFLSNTGQIDPSRIPALRPIAPAVAQAASEVVEVELVPWPAVNRRGFGRRDLFWMLIGLTAGAMAGLAVGLLMRPKS